MQRIFDLFVGRGDVDQVAAFFNSPSDAARRVDRFPASDTGNRDRKNIALLIFYPSDN